MEKVFWKFEKDTNKNQFSRTRTQKSTYWKVRHGGHIYSIVVERE
jgi:hypothetical protein